MTALLNEEADKEDGIEPVTKKTRIESADSDSGPPDEDSESEDEFAAFPNWCNSATKAEEEAMDKKIHPDPKTMRLGSLFPCGVCEKWTPHGYIRGPPPGPLNPDRWVLEYDQKFWTDGPPELTPRTVNCMVCDAIWNHQVNFKGIPTKRYQLLRLRHPEKKPKEEETVKAEPARDEEKKETTEATPPPEVPIATI